MRYLVVAIVAVGVASIVAIEAVLAIERDYLGLGGMTATELFALVTFAIGETRARKGRASGLKDQL